MEAATLINRPPSSLRTPDLLATFEAMAPFDEAAGDRLRQAREKLNLSQFEAAHKIGVTDKTLGKWERAQAAPRQRNWREIERVYGVTVQEVRGEPEPEQLDRIEKMLADLMQMLGATQPGEDDASSLREALDRLPKPPGTKPNRQGRSAPRRRREAS